MVVNGLGVVVNDCKWALVGGNELQINCPSLWMDLGWVHGCGWSVHCKWVIERFQYVVNALGVGCKGCK